MPFPQMNHHDFNPTCAFTKPQGGTSYRERITEQTLNPNRTSLIAAYSHADYYSCNLGFNLVVDSHQVQLFLLPGQCCSQLLNINAQMTIPVLNNTPWMEVESTTTVP